MSIDNKVIIPATLGIAYLLFLVGSIFIPLFIYLMFAYIGVILISSASITLNRYMEDKKNPASKEQTQEQLIQQEMLRVQNEMANKVMQSLQMGFSLIDTRANLIKQYPHDAVDAIIKSLVDQGHIKKVEEEKKDEPSRPKADKKP